MHIIFKFIYISHVWGCVIQIYINLINKLINALLMKSFPESLDFDLVIEAIQTRY